MFLCVKCTCVEATVEGVVGWASCDSVPANCAMVSVVVVDEVISLCFGILGVCYVGDSIADLQALIW